MPPRSRPSTEDRQIPGAFEGETIARRRFMTRGAYLAGAAAAAAFTLPALGFALGPIFQRQRISWQDVGPLSRFTASTYVPVTVTISPGIGDAGKSTAYVRRHNEQIDGPVKDRYDEVVAISTRCAHVGCPVQYIAASRGFVCPCHGGVYDFRGVRVGGPPPRPLDRFYTRIRNARVELGPRFSVNSELKRFSLRDPGEALDGIGQYVYPPRLDTSDAPPGAKS
jgi:quinol---cytochrome c reductase iron-sulfur subunit, bacillus type